MQWHSFDMCRFRVWIGQPLCAGQIEQLSSDLSDAKSRMEAATGQLTADFKKQLEQVADQSVQCGAEGPCVAKFPLVLANDAGAAVVACSAETEGALNYDKEGKTVQVCNGKKVVDVQAEIVGSSRAQAGESCAYIFEEGDSHGDGVYHVLVDSTPSRVSRGFEIELCK